MEISLNSGAAHMQMLENWQATIAGNLANVSSPGYQKQVFEISIPDKGAANVGGPTGDRGLLPLGRVRNSFHEGSIRATGNPYDMAVQSGGFFAVRGENGVQLFTKDGEFHLDEAGTLVNKLGYPVMSEGDSLTVNLSEGPITMSNDGTVSQNGENIGQITVFEFTRPEALDRVSGNYFRDPSQGAGAQEVEDPIVLQGHLMGSSVSPLGEMISMIEVSRAYEISQKLIRESDERRDRAIQTFSV